MSQCREDEISVLKLHSTNDYILATGLEILEGVVIQNGRKFTFIILNLQGIHLYVTKVIGFLESTKMQIMSFKLCF